MGNNLLYYGDNLEVLRKYIQSGTVDLCYIDPPFNSKRTYNQIYNNVGTEDRAQSQAFTDTWIWDDIAIEGYQEILDNSGGRFTKQTIELIKGFNNVVGKGSLLAYLVSMTLRVTEIQRVLKPTGSFYLHCDPTASHYLKLVLDAIFVPNGGDFRNEIVWCYSIGGKSKKTFGGKHDIIFWYTKGNEWTFNTDNPYVRMSRKPDSHMKTITDGDGVIWQEKTDAKTGKIYRYPLDKVVDDYWNIEQLNREDAERLGYPTQKPEALLKRIIASGSNEGDLILDAYCGCGTTIVVAQELKRKWVGMDITYQSIALILRRLEDTFGKVISDAVVLDGIPRDMASAQALANKKDDRVRKEFEKWAVLTYTGNRAIIHQKKRADAGIDGIAYFRTNNIDNAKIILQVKSGSVGRGDIAKIRGDMQRESAPMAILLTLEPPTAPMIAEAKNAGFYHHDLMDRNYDTIQIVTIQDMIENGKILDIPMSLEVLREAQLKAAGNQLSML
jgi:site-specific DNA-methyltransferase (adenine-specific)